MSLESAFLRAGKRGAVKLVYREGDSRHVMQLEKQYAKRPLPVQNCLHQ